MGVGTIGSQISEISPAIANDVNENEVFTYTHSRGEMLSATVGQLVMCPFFRDMPPEKAAMMARMYNRGVSAIKENTQQAENLPAEELPVSSEDEHIQDDNTIEPTDVSVAKNRDAESIVLEKDDVQTQESPPAADFEITDTSVRAADTNSEDKMQAGKPEAPSSGNHTEPSVRSEKDNSSIQIMWEKPEVGADTIAAQSGTPEKNKSIEHQRQSAQQTAETDKSSLPATSPESIRTFPEADVVKEPAEIQAHEPHPQILAEVETAPVEQEGIAGETLHDEAAGDENMFDAGDTAEYILPKQIENEVRPDAIADMSLPAAEPELVAQVYSAETVEAELTAYELSGPIEEIEHAIFDMAERIDALKEVERDEVHVVLDEIACTSREVALGFVDIDDAETVPADAGNEEALEELFIKLFERLELDYTPELIDSFVKLAVRCDITEIMQITDKNDDQETVKEKGTHEAITKLMATLSRIKRAVLYACQIGRSTLTLYRQQLQTA